MCVIVRAWAIVDGCGVLCVGVGAARAVRDWPGRKKRFCIRFATLPVHVVKKGEYINRMALVDACSSVDCCT